MLTGIDPNNPMVALFLCSLGQELQIHLSTLLIPSIESTRVNPSQLYSWLRKIHQDNAQVILLSSRKVYTIFLDEIMELDSDSHEHIFLENHIDKKYASKKIFL
jgi:hypothetical protein